MPDEAPQPPQNHILARFAFWLSVLAIAGAFVVILWPTSEHLNEGAMQLIASILAFWMGRLGR